MAPAEDDGPATSIRVELSAPDAMQLWRAVAKVATAFGEDRCFEATRLRAARAAYRVLTA